MKANVKDGYKLLQVFDTHTNMKKVTTEVREVQQIHHLSRHRKLLIHSEHLKPVHRVQRLQRLHICGIASLRLGPVCKMMLTLGFKSLASAANLCRIKDSSAVTVCTFYWVTRYFVRSSAFTSGCLNGCSQFCGASHLKLQPRCSGHCNVNGCLLLPYVWVKRPGPARLSCVTRDRVQIQSGMAAGFNLRLRGSLLNKGGSVRGWEAAHTERNMGPMLCVCDREWMHEAGRTFNFTDVFRAERCIVFILFLFFTSFWDPPRDVRKERETRGAEESRHPSACSSCLTKTCISNLRQD